MVIQLQVWVNNVILLGTTSRVLFVNLFWRCTTSSILTNKEVCVCKVKFKSLWTSATYICFTINRWIHSWTPPYYHITIYCHMTICHLHFTTSKCRAWLLLAWVLVYQNMPKVNYIVLDSLHNYNAFIK